MSDTPATRPTSIPRTFSAALKRGYKITGLAHSDLSTSQLDSIISIDETGTRKGTLVGIVQDQDDLDCWLAKYKDVDGGYHFVSIPKTQPVPDQD